MIWESPIAGVTETGATCGRMRASRAESRPRKRPWRRAPFSSGTRGGRPGSGDRDPCAKRSIFDYMKDGVSELPGKIVSRKKDLRGPETVGPGRVRCDH